MVNVVGILYPGLYDYLVEVPVIPPGVIPPGTCITSDVRSKCNVTAEVSCRPEVESCGVDVWQVPVPQPEVPVMVMACGIEVRQAVECENIVCRTRAISECVEVRHVEDDVDTQVPQVCAGVTVTYLGASAIGCTSSKVLADVTVRPKVTATLMMCTCRSKP